MLDESKSEAIVKELSLLAVKNGHVTKEDIRRSLGAELAANENDVDDMMNLLCEQDITVLENGGTPVCANLNVWMNHRPRRFLKKKNRTTTAAR